MKKNKFIFLILLFSFLPLASFFVTPLLFHTHDGVVHLARIAAYEKALLDHEFPVRWAGDLNYGYGMPLFNFIYQLPYFVSSIFVILGSGLVTSFKLSMAFGYLLAGLSMFLFAREFFGDERKAFLVAIFYQFAPFRIVELLVRGSFGEVYAYAFIPLILYFVTRIEKDKGKAGIGIAFSTALMVVSHNALSLVFFGAAVLFALLFTTKKRIQALIYLGIGLCLSAFYWFPALMEHKYTYGDLFMRNMYKSYFPSFQDFLIPNIFNNPKFQNGGVDVQIGIFHIFAMLAGVYLLFKKTNSQLKKIIGLSLVLVVGALFIMQPISTFVWEHQNFLRQFQFPWRLLGLVAFATSLCSICFFSFEWFKKNSIYWIVIILTVISTAYFWKPPLGFDKIDENYYWNYPLNTTYFGETDLIWSAGRAYSFPKARVEVIDGAAKITNFKKQTTAQSFDAVTQNGAKLVDHTQYYPGWKVYVNGKEVSVEYQYQIYPGQLVFKIPPGNNTIMVKFTETKLRLAADILSGITLLFLLLLLFLKIPKKYV